jgi:hypothetical protein
MVQSQVDRPDLASRLIRAQIQFSFHMVVAHLRLLRYGWGSARKRGGGVRAVTKAVR